MKWTRRFNSGFLSAAAVAVVLGCALPTGTVHADMHDKMKTVRKLLLGGEIRPLDDILANVAKQYPGEVIDVDFELEDMRWAYEIKLIAPDGRVMEIEIDAKTGQILEVETKHAYPHRRR